ncbi:MAG: citrate synthase [Verrucomicrobia bacterium]|nr:citrate synthase [Verrucomicrobiota bacterium]MCH8511736.1 citrate synthase [Kiritimatiellia bacterium]
MNLETQKDAATVQFQGKTYTTDVLIGSEGEVGLDMRDFRNKTGAICLDPGFGNSGSCSSAITFLDGEKGLIRHRGYKLQDLADNCNYLEVAYLLMLGELPTPYQYRQFQDKIHENNFLGPSLQELLNHYPTQSHPMAVLASVVLSLTGFYSDLGVDKYYELDMDVVRLLTKTPLIAAHNYRRKRGMKYIAPDNNLGYAENFLYSMFGRSVSPEKRKIMAKALEKLLIIHADHEQNCSTSTVRVISSSNANVYAAVGGGIGALWGPLHGGANEAVINMLEYINMQGGDLDAVIKRAKDKNDEFRLMGFGHRVYKTYDPRAQIAKQVVDELLEDLGVEEPLVDIAMKLEKIAIEDDYFVSRNLYPNVDFYTGTAYKAMGIPKEMFTVLFAMGRMAGWLAHLLEFRADENRRISRPRQIYTGVNARDYVPMSDR